MSGDDGGPSGIPTVAPTVDAAPTRPSSPPPASGIAAGTLVDHFKLIRMVGRGGMSDVYLARDVRLGRRVALKWLHTQRAGSREALEQLLVEARITARFSHPHIVAIHDVGEFQGRPYLALEYLPGDDLRARFHRQPPSVAEAMRLGRAMAGALEEAHGHGILHRDLKPENVVIPEDGRPRVVDFGIAQPLPRHQCPDRDSLTDEGLADAALPSSCGTPGYMAPEQWRGEDCTEASDIWSLGVILYEMLVGRRPYEDLEPQHALFTARVADDAPVPGNERMREIAPRLTDLVLACLAKGPADRPSAAEVSRRLDALLARGPRRETQSPFRGLQPFTEDHAGLFYGRDAEIEAFVERLRGAPTLPVVGPSGAGKSSFVRAGVFPRLREQGSWLILSTRPGSDPIASLVDLLTDPANTSAVGGDGDSVAISAAELRESPSLLGLRLLELAEGRGCRVMLFVDQFEEVLTLVQDDDLRSAYVEAVCSAADDPEAPVRVVFSLRDDFLGRMAEGEHARRALGRVAVLRSPGPAALRETLSRPLEAVGYDYDDPGLVDEMIDSVRGEAASLPLLQFTAQMLWERRDRDGRRLRRCVFEAAGGVAGALAEHADGVLEGLTPEQVSVARQILLRLATPERTRKVLSSRQALEGLGEVGPRVLERLTGARLIVVRRARHGDTGDDQLEVVHEALIREWGQLSRWIEESHEELAFLAEVGQAARLWEQRGGRPDEVWTGDALGEARRIVARCSAPVTEQVRAFLRASEARARHLRRRRRGLILAGLGALALVAIASTVVAVVLADKERIARFERARAESRGAQLASEGALAALERGDMVEARAKLRASLETEDSSLARALWWRLSSDPLRWKTSLASTVNQVVYSPDGATLAAASSDTAIYLIDVETLATRVLHGHRDQAIVLAFSPDGRSLASGTWSSELRLWDLETGRFVTLADHGDGLGAVSFSADGLHLAASGYDGLVRIWDLSDPTAAPLEWLHAKRVYALDFSPDGARLAAAGRELVIRIWDVATREEVQTLEGHTRTVMRLEYGPTGRSLVSGGYDETVRVWDLGQGALSHQFAGHQGAVKGVSFHPDGRSVASCGDDETLRSWSLEAGGEARVVGRSAKPLYTLDHSPDGRFLTTAGWENLIYTWDLSTAGLEASGAGHADGARGVDLTPDGATLVSAGADGMLRKWDTATGRQLAATHAHDDCGLAVRVSPDGETVASCGCDEVVRLWHLPTLAETGRLLGPGRHCNALDFHPDGTTLVAASGNLVHVWDLVGGAEERPLSLHERRVDNAVFSPDGARLASSELGGAIVVSDPDTGRVVHQWSGHEGAVRGLAWSADGQRVVSAGDDGTVRSWDSGTGQMRVLAQEEARAYYLDHHPADDRVGVPLSDGTALILGGDAVVRLQGHRGEVNVLRFAPGGARAVTASDDGTIRLWETATGHPSWNAPLMTAEGPLLASHTGWWDLDTGEAVHAQHAWQRAVTSRARQASMDDAGDRLCMRTHDGSLEAWNTREDVQDLVRKIEDLRQVVATPIGCVSLGGAGVHLHDGVHATELVGEAEAVAGSEAGILVADGQAVQMFDIRGQPAASLPTGGGISALARCGDAVAVGFEDGNLEMWSTAAEGDRPPVTFEGLPSSPVTSLLEGPLDTVIVGFASGECGLWDHRHGSRLFSTRLHGPVVHLRRVADGVHVATELGSHIALDLGPFFDDHCDLLRDVWEVTPVAWTPGGAVHEPAPDDHRCSSSRRRDEETPR